MSLIQEIKIHFSENIRRYFHLNGVKRCADIYACQYIKSMTLSYFGDYSQLELQYLERCHLCYFTKNLVFLQFATFKKHMIFKTLWQEQAWREREKKVSFVAESAEKGVVHVAFFSILLLMKPSPIFSTFWDFGITMKLISFS